MGRTVVLLVVVMVVGMMGAALAQPEAAIAPVDIVNEGETMGQAATEGNSEGAYFHAARILGAAGTELEGRSPDELYYIGLAHMYQMAHYFEAARDQGLSGEPLKFASKMAQQALCPYEDVRVVSHGERIALSDYLVPGQTVVFDFFSQFCGPCVMLKPYVEKLAQTRFDIVLVSVDINRPGMQGIDWGSPVAQQFGLRSIPHFKIYGPDGKLQAEGDQAYGMIMQWVQAMEG